jgi:glycosyltransferase involved in cell wall biosynthesis
LPASICRLPGNNMHIVMVSDTETQGGAAIAASRLAEALCQSGHQLTRLVAVPDGKSHLWATRQLAVSYPLPLSQRLIWHTLTVANRERFGNLLVRKRLDQLLTELHPDVINLHNLHLTSHPRWSPVLASVCTARAPTVWTLHDMWSFTGRCAYNQGCEKFISGCDATCPTAEDYPVLPRGQIAGAWMERRNLLQGTARNLSVVTPSCWLAAEARRGLWANHRIEVIPYGLDLSVYCPINRVYARNQLGLPSQGRMLLFAAQNLTDARKGWPVLREALPRLAASNLTLLTLGNGELPSTLGEVEVRQFPYTGDEHQKTLLYNAADLLVHPAPVDNAPLVVAEALACGVPVASFAIGGLPEMVIPGRTGWLADEVAAEPLAKLIQLALDEIEHRADLRHECRLFAEARFNFGQQAKLYSSLFLSLLPIPPTVLQAAPLNGGLAK